MQDITTRHASKIQETRIANKFNGFVVNNSGAGKFNKSDIVINDVSLSIECKTCLSKKKSFSIKEEWLKKHKGEAFVNRLDNSVLAFNFYYNDKQDYYVIDDTLMSFLIDKLREEYRNVR